MRISPSLGSTIILARQPYYGIVILSKLKRLREPGVAIMIVEDNIRKALTVSEGSYVLVDGACAAEADANCLSSEDASK